MIFTLNFSPCNDSYHPIDLLITVAMKYGVCGSQESTITVAQTYFDSLPIQLKCELLCVIWKILYFIKTLMQNVVNLIT